MGEGLSQKRVRRMYLARFAVLVLGLYASIGLSAAHAGQRPAFCKGSIVRNYAAPLRNFPPVHQPPPTEAPLHFGPPRLTITSSGSLMASKGRIGIAIEGSSYEKAPPIPWDAEATLQRVDGKGRIKEGWGVRRQRHTHIAINSQHQLDLTFLVGGKPAYYRVDTYLNDRHTGRSVHYAQYVRVLRRSFSVRLRLNRRVVAPGDTLFARLFDYGTVGVYHAVDYILEQYGVNGWELTPFPPIHEPAVLVGIGAGGIVKCDRITLPATATPGTYRVGKDISIIPKKRWFPAFAVFTVQ